ncbi:MAG: hypothetical protein EXR92_03380 [Gemmatimonadetes bacterium]|nr:hypothetical protein [Gemmatimonadota bacterium]
MNVEDAVRARRSVKSFTGRPVSREAIEFLLELATLAPNHRMTEPWGFVVLGPEARRAYGQLRGEAKAKSASVEDRSAADAIVAKVVAEFEAVPLIVVFTQRRDARPDVEEEDHATVSMGIQSFLLGALSLGLGTHVKTVMDPDLPATRAALGLAGDEKVVALVHVGEPAEVRPSKPRTPASARTRWLP